MCDDTTWMNEAALEAAIDSFADQLFTIADAIITNKIENRNLVLSEVKRIYRIINKQQKRLAEAKRGCLTAILVLSRDNE